MRRVERETNNDLRSSLLGSDRPSGLCNLMKPTELYVLTTSPSLWCPPHCSDILCCLGVMVAFKESDLRSVKMFPSQKKSLEFVKQP